LNQRIEEMRRLRDELGELLAEWDARLAATHEGKRAHLLDTLGARPIIESTRRQRRHRPDQPHRS
jgi:hypothetical protein